MSYNIDIDDLEEEEMIYNGVQVETQFLNHAQRDLESRMQVASMILLCGVGHALYLLSLMSKRSIDGIEFILDRGQRRGELMSLLVNTQRCREIIRMSPEAFILLCEKLRATNIVKDSIKATVEEKVAKFLHIIGHNVRNRTASFFFHRSGATVSRHFHNVLHGIIALEEEFIIQPSGSIPARENVENSRFFPYFKDCLGAIDGTHVRVKVPTRDAPRFRGRKDYSTQNVFVACDFDMKFTYVLAGWEGTASDSRILKDALSRDDPLIIPEGKYYLGDAGFMLKRHVLTPYRGVRYHLKEYSGRGPQNAKELFNNRHASLRNVIERTFGMLKKRFPIIGSGTEPHYAFTTMRNIVVACCILHNFLRNVDSDDSLLDEVDHDLEQEEEDRAATQLRDDDYRQGAALRDSIANEMWNEYQHARF